jgi:outer membrane protein assembly factor BamB
MNTLRLLRHGRLFLWSAVGLLQLFGFLVGYELYTLHNPPSTYIADERLLDELKDRRLGEGSPAGAPLGEWPQWRGPRRDGVSPETGLLKSWPREGPRVLWRTPCGEGYSALAVASGRAYTLYRDDREQEGVVCWDAVTGQERWRLDYPCPCKLPWGSGPRSTPTVAGDHIYTVGATGLLHCLKAATGEVVWRKDLLNEFRASNLEWGVSFSPLLEGDLLLTNPGGPDGHSIVALDRHTGAKVWAALDDRAGFSSPLAVTAAGVRQLIFFTGDGLVSVSPDRGKLYWRYPWETHRGLNVATPIALDDYLFISSGYNRGCALLKVEKDGTGGLKVERVYETTAMCNHFSSCVLYQEHLYGFTDPGLLTCMQFRSGQVLWQKRGFRNGSVCVADGHLLILGEEGQLALAEATPEGYRQAAACRISRARCWTTPVLAGGRLYLRTAEEVVCLDLKNP